MVCSSSDAFASVTWTASQPTSRSASCSMDTSSTLNPASPISANSRASAPGASGISMVTCANSRAGVPCLPGMRRVPWRPHSRKSSRSASVRSGSSRMSIRRPRAAWTSTNCSRTASALAEMICRQSPGSPVEMRVTSRRPCPASFRCDAGTSFRTPPVSALIRCGRCDTWATASSWCAGPNVTIRAPQRRASSWTSRTVAAAAVSCGATTQVRSTNRSARAATGPARCEPAIGCPPQYRFSPDARRARRSLITVPFTEPTSVTVACG